MIYKLHKTKKLNCSKIIKNGWARIVEKIEINDVKKVVSLQGYNAENMYQNCIIIQKEDNTIWNLASSIENYQKKEGAWSPIKYYEAE